MLDPCPLGLPVILTGAHMIPAPRASKRPESKYIPQIMTRNPIHDLRTIPQLRNTP